MTQKYLRQNAQKKKEEQLEKQVEILQHRLEEVKKEAAVDKEAEVSKKDVKDNVTLDDDLKDNLDSSLDDALENNLEEALATNSEDNNIASDYDVILQVKPEKIPKIKSSNN